MTLRRWLFARRSADLPAPLASAMGRIDATLERYRAGEQPDDDAYREMGETFSQYHDFLCELNGTDNNNRFFAGDRADYYLNALKLTGLHHPHHSAWPFISGIRWEVIKPLRKRAQAGTDAWTNFCLIIPALIDGDVALALRCYRQLEGDDFLLDLALRWVHETTHWQPESNNAIAGARFLKEVKPPPLPPIGRGLEDWQRWALAAAPYPSYFLDPRTTLEPPRPPAVCRMELADWWRIDDRDSAQDIILWLFDEGHRKQMTDDLARVEAGDDIGDRHAFVAESRRLLPRHGILAWDLCRAIDVARCACRAGYLTEDETWSCIRQAAAALRGEYLSWNGLVDDFVLGHAYWNADGSQHGTHAGPALWFKTSPQSPWREIAWEIDPAAFEL
ncbi:MAG: DUF1266 domain-containing protein [Myxococcales bacterium]|nr:DUF1266 domain-containing protein [Myxococcales bacterium]